MNLSKKKPREVLGYLLFLHFFYWRSVPCPKFFSHFSLSRVLLVDFNIVLEETDSIIIIFDYLLFFFSIRHPPGLLPVLGPLERYMTPTLDTALLSSSRAGTDLGRTSGIY